MVLASHVIFSAYGFWLPNDPRGSWSDFVGAWELFRFGDATKTDTRVSVAGSKHDKSVRLAAKDVLKYPAVQFDGRQAKAIAEAFAVSVRRGEVKVWACAILPEHVHLVLARHECKAETIVNLLKGAATRALIDQKLHPLGEFASADGKVPKCWARGCWKVYLNHIEDIDRAIRYVEENPLKEGKPAQRWKFVTKFDSLTV